MQTQRRVARKVSSSVFLPPRTRLSATELKAACQQPNDTLDDRAERSEPLEDEGSAGEQQVNEGTANDACAIRRVVEIAASAAKKFKLLAWHLSDHSWGREQVSRADVLDG
jgi:hypothetical protein